MAIDDLSFDDLQPQKKKNIRDLSFDDIPSTSGESALSAGLISAGQWLDKKAAGLRGAVRDYVPGGEAIVKGADWLDRKMGVAPPDDTQYRDGEADARMAPLRSEHPIASFVGGVAPDLAVINPASMAAMAALDPGSVGERATNAGLTYGLGKAGQYGGEKIAGALASRAQSKAADIATQEAANVTRNATLAEAKTAGYVFPPSSVNPSIVNRTLEGLAGKVSTQQGAAIRNQNVTNALAKKALAIPDDAPLNKETIGVVRNTAGQVYDTLKKFGPVQTDDAFRGALDHATAEYRTLLADFPSLKNGAIDSLIADLDKPAFNSSSAVELVKRLRSDARANLRAFDDPEKLALGRVQQQAQAAVEDLFERNLNATGNEGFMQVFRNARAMIAKTHTVEDALEESTGKVVAGKIGKEFSKGRPLTGELSTIGRVAEAYPKALQNVNTSMPGVSPLDYMAGLMTGTTVGGPAGVAAAFARPMVRGGLLSDAYQGAMVNAPKYKLTAADKALAKTDPELMRKLGGLLGVTGLRAFQ